MSEKEGLKKIVDSAITYASVLLVMIISYTITFIVFDSTYIYCIYI